MGYSIAAAIGASLADNKKNNIIASIGDGSVQMNIQEIQNIYYYNLPIKIFILNNKGYGMVKQTIDTWLKSNYIGCDLKSGLSMPNFLKVFKAYQIESINIKNNKLLKNKLDKILNKKGPIMINLMIDPNQKIEPKVKFGSPIDIMNP
jgi:acetolactate synthase-1/2/3 large subunit